MKLFNPYQSRGVQFSLELFSRLEREGSMHEDAVRTLAQRYGLDYAGQVVDPLCRLGLLHREQHMLSINEGVSIPHLPEGILERRWLERALKLPEATLFLDEETRTILEKTLSKDTSDDFFSSIELYTPQGEPLPSHISGEDFRTLLDAVRRRQIVRYTYRTRTEKTPRLSCALPWKLEYSVYDRRWWVLLYITEEDRTVKAWLDNLEDVHLVGPSSVPEEHVLEAIDRLLAPEPVVLHIQRTKGALERCFLVFENQLFERTRQISEDYYSAVFRYYRFDRGEILRKLLYLGSAVELVSPDSLRKELLVLVEQALSD